MNHKRRRPKNRRAGCLLCKPWKCNGVARTSPAGESHANHVRRMAAQEAYGINVFDFVSLEGSQTPGALAP